MRLGGLILALMILTGCQDRYRYKCQDPANWEAEECTKPKCAASGYCTEWLIDTGEEESETS